MQTITPRRSMLGMASPAAVGPSGPKAKDCGGKEDGVGCRGKLDASSGGKGVSAPVYAGPTRLELAFQRCEDGDYMLWAVGCKSGALGEKMLRRMPADGPGGLGIVAREVAAALELLPPRIRLTPRPGPNVVALVGSGPSPGCGYVYTMPVTVGEWQVLAKRGSGR